MRKIASILLLFLLLGCQDKEFNLYPESHYIYYTTTDGEPVSYGGSCLSNTYENGQGILVFRSPVSSIDNRAFYCCNNLKSITIPDDVTSIGSQAFYGCRSLESFYGKFASDDHRCLIRYGTLYSFASAGLTEYTIPDNITSIGGYAFSNCTLTNITLPESITSIGEWAFSLCDNLTSITIPESVTSIGELAFYGSTGELVFNSKLIEKDFDNSNYPAKPENGGWLYGALFTKLTIGDSVTRIGEQALSECSSLTSVTIGDGVTSIGQVAFYECSSLASVTIGDNVSYIGEMAFYGCNSLKEFNGKFASDDHRCLIVDGVLCFFAPAGLTDYTIPNSVTSIGDYAFYMSGLASVIIPDSVTSIGIGAFCECYSLTNVTIGNGVTSIKYAAFADDHNLVSINIPDSVTSIEEDAFVECFSLTNITLPNSLTSIGEWAFSGCSSLTSITIPDSVTSVGVAAFSDCSSLKAFYGKFASADNRCLIVDGVLNSFAPAGLTRYTIPDSVTSIGSYAFDDCNSLASITIPDSVTLIGDAAFAFCDSLTSVTIPNSVTSIGSSAFSRCSNLTNIALGNGITTIGKYAFLDCTSLTSVTVPNSVTSIGDYAFYRCSSLTSVYCKPTTPPAGGTWMFDSNASGRKIYVPRNSVSTYKSASYWRQYADYIVGYNF